jgi:hypothetical protein
MDHLEQAGPHIPEDVVKEQLQRLTRSPQFSQSRRYPTFLDHVVLKTLSGHQEELKERIIGVEAFGRPAEYDVSSDPIVRVTAGEVRKRLAQYYYDPAHQNELRIELHPGSYVPEFRFASGQPAAADPPVANFSQHRAAVEESEPPIPSRPDEIRTPRWRRAAVLTGAVIAVAVVMIWTAIRIGQNSAYERLWRPLVQSPGPVVVVVGSVTVLNPPVYSAGPTPDSVGLHPLFAQPVALADMIATNRIEQSLFHYSKPSVIQSSADTTYSDLQKGPLILVSAFDNAWTMRLTHSLRYHFVQSAVDVYEIDDRTDPTHRRWPINTRDKFDRVTHDYGLVARFHDPTTEQVAIVAAGIGENGTLAASELLSDKKYLQDLEHQGLFPKGNQDWEAVIETTTIDGKSGPPHVVASYAW